MEGTNPYAIDPYNKTYKQEYIEPKEEDFYNFENIKRKRKRNNTNKKPELPHGILGTQYEEEDINGGYGTQKKKKRCIRCTDEVYDYIVNNLDKIKGSSIIRVTSVDPQHIQFTIGPYQSVTVKRGLRESIQHQQRNNNYDMKTIGYKTPIYENLDDDEVEEREVEKNRRPEEKIDTQYAMVFKNGNQIDTRHRDIHGGVPMVDEGQVDEEEDIIYPIQKYQKNQYLEEIMEYIQSQMEDDRDIPQTQWNNHHQMNQPSYPQQPYTQQQQQQPYTQQQQQPYYQQQIYGQQPQYSYGKYHY